MIQSSGLWRTTQQETMTTIDLIALERQRYLSSARSRRDWLRYVHAVERLQAEREGQRPRRRRLLGGRRAAGRGRLGRAGRLRPGGDRLV
jgi:hypothetical protein